MGRRNGPRWPRAIALWGYATASDEEWRQAEDDAYRFAKAWAGQAIALGWTEENVIGLIWSLQGRRVIAMTDRCAATVSAGGEVTFYRRVAP